MTAAKKVLIIEDNADLCEIAQIAFESEGFEVELALNGMDGIVKAVEFKPDAILLDIMMPQMDGYEVLEAIRKNSSMDILIVISSNLSQQKDIDKALELGADAYLQKSNYTPSEMVVFVKEAMEKKLSGEPQNEKISVETLVFSNDILSRFSVIKSEKTAEKYLFWLEEKNLPPQSANMEGILPIEEVTGMNVQGMPCVIKVQPRAWKYENGRKTTFQIEIENGTPVLQEKTISD